MDYARVFASDAADSEILSIFDDGFDKGKFAEALGHAAPVIWTGSGRSISVLSQVFCLGVSCFKEVLEALDNSFDQTVHEEDLVAENEPSEDSITSLEGSTKEDCATTDPPDFAAGNDAGQDGEDITNFAREECNVNTDSQVVADPGKSNQEVDLAASSLAKPLAEIDISQDTTSVAYFVNGDNQLPPELTVEQKIAKIGHIADVIVEWFSGISEQAKKHNKDAFSIVFGPPGSEKTPNDSHLHSLLFYTKCFVEKALELDDLERAGTLRKLVLLIHEILRSLFIALTLEADTSSTNSAIVVKSLLYCFFLVDLSEVLQSLLNKTTKKQLLVYQSGDDQLKKSEKILDINKDLKAEKAELKLSYEAVMRIYAIYLSLANCPINLILVDKVSLSLDITTPEDISPNAYVHFLELIDFSQEDTFFLLSNRLVIQFAAMFNYFYEMSPDILRHSLKHSSFFGWITGNTLSSGRYLSTDTLFNSTSFANVTLDPVDPFLYEVGLYEYKKRLQHIKKGEDTVAGVQSTSYLVLTFQMFQLVHNKTFTKELVTQTSEKIALLDIWLCISSYIHHYQYRSVINDLGARVSLLFLLKLTSPKAPTLPILRERKIDENKWKLCHHKHPVIPLDENCFEKEALLYIIDVLQVTFRYNLSKRLDMENVKIALTVLYQVLLELEAHPTDGLHTYSWNELYLALVNFVRFVARSQNEEGVKYIIEELFSVIQLLLSPVFDKVLEKSSDFFSLGYHPAKSMNFGLLYIMLEQHDVLEALFKKYIRRAENFNRVEKAFRELKKQISATSNRELSQNDVVKLLNDLSLLRDEKMKMTTIKLQHFNYAETFKYFDKYGDYEDFPKQQELIKSFVSIFDTDWVGDPIPKR